MAVSLVISSVLQFYLAPQLIYRHELLGKVFLFPNATKCFRRQKANHSFVYRIYRPAKTATQSGDWHEHTWRMDWDILQKGHRWENPLIGWQSSADAMQGTHINFKTKEDAIEFAEKQGYEFYVQEPNVRKFVPKAYANNFLHESRKLKHIKTK